MKKLLFTLTSILVFIMMFSCASLKPTLVEDSFYKNNSYFTSGRYYRIGSVYDNLKIMYRTENGTPNIQVRFKYKNHDYNTSYSLAIKYKNGSIESFGGNQEYKHNSDYSSVWFDVYFYTAVINEYKNIDTIRITIDRIYRDIEVTDKQNIYLQKMFTDIQTEASNYYKATE